MYVYVPPFLGRDGVPEEANNLSKDTQLPIRMGVEGDGIDSTKIAVVRVPEVRVCDWARTVKAGYIHTIDYTNEFVSFSNNVFLEILGPNTSNQYPPTLRERHLARFRRRYPTAGPYQFRIIDNDVVLEEGSFNVED